MGSKTVRPEAIEAPLRPCRCSCAVAACGALILLAVACTPPIRQFDLKHQTLTCEQANDSTYRTLQAMGFNITAFEPATVTRQGTLRGTRDEHGAQNVTVVITCDGRTADVNASEDGKWLGQLEFKRGFYLSFTAMVTQAEITAAANREEARRPLQQKKEKGLNVLLAPVRGLGAKLDFDLDLAAGGVLPVQITITNASTRTYSLDPDSIVLIRKEGTRVPPLPVADAAQRVADSARQKTTPDAPAPDSAEVTRRLEARLLSGRSVAANQTLKGYLFFPLADYVKGRVSLEDQESEETEGFVVEF